MEISKEEAVRRAVRACGSVAHGGRNRLEVRHLAERDGQHLMFVGTSSHGYYLVIHATGTVREVGEKEAGITTGWVGRYFGVGQHPMLMDARNVVERNRKIAGTANADPAI